MSSFDKHLARVKSVRTSIKDHGCLTFWVAVEYENGNCQNVGGLALDTWNKDFECRVGTAYGCEMLIQLLKFFNVDDLSGVSDRLIYILGEEDSSFLEFKPRGLERLRLDHKDNEVNTLIFSDVLYKMENLK